MAESAARSITISHATELESDAAYAFHQRRAGEYLWPRQSDDFATLIDEQHVFIVSERQHVVGLCYVTQDGERWEFGGLYVEDSLRGHGVAAALGRIAITTAYLTDAPSDLIAHVHEANDGPRRVLTAQLGFEPTGVQEIPPIEPPPSMKRNARGEVVGDLFRFRRQSLSEFADWFDDFAGTLHGKAPTGIALSINAIVWTERASLMPWVRRLAQE